jgi:hypothetical protein
MPLDGSNRKSGVQRNLNVLDGGLQRDQTMQLLRKLCKPLLWVLHLTSYSTEGE